MSNITLINAEARDSKLILKWRNDPLSREMFRGSHEISFEEHNSWYQKALQNCQIKILIAVNNNRKVGVIRLNFNDINDVAEVSINLNPDFRGMGFGLEILKNCTKYIERNFKKCSELTAEVKKVNGSSIKIFTNAGYKLVKETKEYYLYALKIF
mgnify:CR=1 FL=1